MEVGSKLKNIHENAFENFAGEMEAILFMGCEVSMDTSVKIGCEVDHLL